jgi:hypothetical protein
LPLQGLLILIVTRSLATLLQYCMSGSFDSSKIASNAVMSDSSGTKESDNAVSLTI